MNCELFCTTKIQPKKLRSEVNVPCAETSCDQLKGDSKETKTNTQAMVKITDHTHTHT